MDANKVKILSYKNNGVKASSGVAKMDVTFDKDKKYQYSVYTYYKDKGYLLNHTYETLSSSSIFIVKGKSYDFKAMILVTNKYGNSLRYFTDYINNLCLDKKSIGATDAYYQVSLPKNDVNLNIEEMKTLNEKQESYLAASRVFLYTRDSFRANVGPYCGLYDPNSNTIYVSLTQFCGSGDMYKAQLIMSLHIAVILCIECLQEIDFLIYHIIISICDDYNKNKKQCGGDYYLRYTDSYEYDLRVEIFTDILSYKNQHFKVNDGLLDIESQIRKKL